MICLQGLYGYAQDYKKIYLGIVQDSLTNEPIQGAHVYFNEMRGAVTDRNGSFKLRTSLQRDTLFCTMVGYHDFKIHLSNFKDSIKINLIPETIILGNVSVFSRQESILKMEKNKPFDVPGIGLPDEPYVKDPLAVARPSVSGFGVNGGISYLVSLFQKEFKELRKLEKILNEKEIHEQRMEQIKMLEDKFNKELVASITGLEGKMLEDFIDTYKPLNQFLSKASDYQIVAYVKKSLYEYKRNNDLPVSLDEILEHGNYD